MLQKHLVLLKVYGNLPMSSMKNMGVRRNLSRRGNINILLINQSVVFFARHKHVIVQKKLRIGELTSRSTSQPTLKKNKQKGNRKLWLTHKKKKKKEKHIQKMKHKTYHRHSATAPQTLNQWNATNSSTNIEPITDKNRQLPVILFRFQCKWTFTKRFTSS